MPHSLPLLPLPVLGVSWLEGIMVIQFTQGVAISLVH